MKKIFLTIAILSIIGLSANAQTYREAALFSRTNNTSSARATAMGGAFTAIGGDLTATTLNPASVGVFRKSQFSFTLSPSFNTTESSGDMSFKDKRNKLIFGSIGSVVSLYTPNSAWKGVNFSINYTNMNNFNRKSHRFIQNSKTSLTEVFALQGYYEDGGKIDSRDLNSFTSGLAYDAFLTYDSNTDYFSILNYTDPSSGEDVFEVVSQEEWNSEKGSQGEYTFALGTNLMDKLYLGMSIGVQSLNYKYSRNYREAAPLNSLSTLDYYDYYTEDKYSGVGANFKFGAIFRPIPEVRLGLSVHTPTWYNMTYDIYSEISSHFNTVADASVGRDKDAYFSNTSYSVDFDMRTPWKLEAGVAAVIEQKFILSFDYELVDYTNAKFSKADEYNPNGDDYDYYGENKDIKSFLKASSNARIGLEARPTPLLSLRAGYAYQQSPYKSEEEQNNAISSLSAGLGLNFGAFFMDFAYVNRHMKNSTGFYSYGDYKSASVNNKYKDNEFKATIGFNF